jgi:hypothetical protein
LPDVVGLRGGREAAHDRRREAEPFVGWMHRMIAIFRCNRFLTIGHRVASRVKEISAGACRPRRDHGQICSQR